jgi:hypothetical protein
VSCRLPFVFQNAVLQTKCPKCPKFDPLIVIVTSGLPAAAVEGEIEEITTDDAPAPPPSLFPLFLLPGIAELQPIVSNKQRKARQARMVFILTSHNAECNTRFLSDEVPNLRT